MSYSSPRSFLDSSGKNLMDDQSDVRYSKTDRKTTIEYVYCLIEPSYNVYNTLFFV